MNAQQLVDLKKKLVKACEYPWKYTPMPELAFLCGVTEQSVILDAIALFYGSSTRFLEEFSQTVKGERHPEFREVPVLQEAHMLHKHFSGESLIEYSPAWEEKEKQILSAKDFQGKDLVYVLLNYPKTVAWQFDYSVSVVNQFVEDLILLVSGASVNDLELAMKRSREIEPYILATLAFHIIQTKAALNFEARVYSGDSMYKKIVESLKCLPLEYTWNIVRNSKGTEDLSVLNTSSNGSFLDRVMSNAVIALEYEPRIEKETDWSKLENLYRRFCGNLLYIPRKNVLLRMIALCS